MSVQSILHSSFAGKQQGHEVFYHSWACEGGHCFGPLAKLMEEMGFGSESSDLSQYTKIISMLLGRKTWPLGIKCDKTWPLETSRKHVKTWLLESSRKKTWKKNMLSRENPGVLASPYILASLFLELTVSLVISILLPMGAKEILKIHWHHRESSEIFFPSKATA